MGGESEIVGGAESKVGEEFEVADGVGAQLQVAGWDVVGCVPAQGSEVGCLDGAGETDGGGC